MNKLNILQNFKHNFFRHKPYAHFEIHSALPEDVYNKLKDEYVIFEDFLFNEQNINENNTRIQINSDKIFELQKQFRSSIWFDFVSYHTSKEFFMQLFEIFYSEIRDKYPNVIKLTESNKNNTDFLSHRSSKNNQLFEFVADCQPGINTPVKKVSSVRGPHVDSPVELIGGLFYLRDHDDISTGGDLNIYDTDKEIYFKGKAEVENIDDLSLFKTIKYSQNHCVFFLNSNYAIHSVTPRSITKSNRYLTNIIIERYKDNNKFFETKRKKNFIKNLFNSIIKKK